VARSLVRFRSSIGRAASLLFVLAACRTTSDRPREVQPAWRAAGRTHLGRPIELAELGDGPRTVLLLAAIHGDEPAGAPLLCELVQRLAADPGPLAGRRVLVVPLANPDGFALGRRGNARGVDLNRNFPARSWHGSELHGTEPLSEPESRLLSTLILGEGVARVVSLHQPADLLDYDGPAGELAGALAGASPLRVHRLGARPGSLGSWAGVDLGLPVITLELPRSADRLSGGERWEAYGPLLLEAIRHPFPDEPGAGPGGQRAPAAGTSPASSAAEPGSARRARTKSLPRSSNRL